MGLSAVMVKGSKESPSYSFTRPEKYFCCSALSFSTWMSM